MVDGARPIFFAICRIVAPAFVIDLMVLCSLAETRLNFDRFAAFRFAFFAMTHLLGPMAASDPDGYSVRAKLARVRPALPYVASAKQLVQQGHPQTDQTALS